MSTTSVSASKLFKPITIGSLHLKHRVVHCPLTRFRADDEHAQTDLVAKYYGQRSSEPGTLLITEATFISPKAGGYARVPGIYTGKQISQWRKVCGVGFSVFPIPYLTIGIFR
jgi:NADPH2 dehydrogenase